MRSTGWRPASHGSRGPATSGGSARSTGHRRLRHGCVVTRGCARATPAPRSRPASCRSCCPPSVRRGVTVRSPPARCAPSPPARVDGHDPKLVALEDVLDVLARADDQRELRRACAHFRNLARADGTEPRQHDGLTVSKTYAGTSMLHGELSSIGAEIVETALHACTDPPSDGDTRTAARRRADALVRMAELALANLNGAGPDGPVRAKPACSLVDRLDHGDRSGLGPHRRPVHRHPPPRRRRAHAVRLHRQPGGHRPGRIAPRRRPITAHHPTPTRPGPAGPRQRLPIPRLHPTPRLDRRPPRHPLEGRRQRPSWPTSCRFATITITSSTSRAGPRPSTATPSPSTNPTAPKSPERGSVDASCAMRPACSRSQGMWKRCPPGRRRPTRFPGAAGVGKLVGCDSVRQGPGCVSSSP